MIVRYQVESDEDAYRIDAVLDALGYETERLLDDSTHAERWSLERIIARYKLTEREADVLRRLVEIGGTPAQMAEALGLARATIKWHLHVIYSKTNTNGREALLRLVWQGPKR